MSIKYFYDSEEYIISLYPEPQHCCNQGSGIRGGRGVYPPGRKNFENTPPPEDLEKIYPPSAAQISDFSHRCNGKEIGILICYKKL